MTSTQTGTVARNDLRPTAEEIDLMREKARMVRLETIRLIMLPKIGHYSSVFSCAELFASLYYGVMSVKEGDPDWEDRDRFTFGKGHAAIGLYPILADLGWLDKDVLDGYCSLGNPLGDHPDMTKVPGIDFSSGSIGHALSNALGMALGARFQGKDFTAFAMMGDGEQQEGQVWEAATAAVAKKVNNLIAIVDNNKYQLDGAVTEVNDIGDIAGKWRAFGFETHEVDGHDLEAVTTLLRRLKADKTRQGPACVIAHTVKGRGIDLMENETGWHLGYLTPGDSEIAAQEIMSKEI
ncbi:transketolase [Paracoccus tegillarcae]|uniref:Transketolase n=1 Tax=Paracoccus tegillarcae TaxID=1529068 RepID=A0A2K9EGY3_9RHOB|nr:transketolase [Paracoccus tegillarcae]AUH34213.1 transketolase [Paracoccus tegillarcae]